MYTKKDLKTYLQGISSGAQFVIFNYVSSEKFYVELKCQVERDQTVELYDIYTREWIKKLSKFTATTWIVRNSFPKLKRLVFRKIYTCHRSSFNKKKKPEFESRNQDCKARVDFRVKIINRNTIKNDKMLKEGLNMSILIDFNHTHKVRAPESYNLLRYSSEIDDVFQKYFDTGCSGTAAKSYHELTLIDKYGEHCPEVFENATMNPSLRHISYVLGAKRKKGNLSTPSYREIMEQKRDSLKELGVDIGLQPDKETVSIITPLMKRVLKEFGLEYVLIDSNNIPQGPTVTFFYVPTKIGALPVACVIHEKINDGFYNSFLVAKNSIELEMGRDFTPKLLILSQFEEQNRSLSSIECKKIASKYSLCTEAWRWLNDDEHKVEKKKRHDVMLNIKSLLYAESSEGAEKIYSEVQYDETVKSLPQLRKYLENLWERKEQWMFFENDSKMSNTLIEMSIRFLKEFIQRRCKSFPAPLMVDVVTNILENHYRRILMSYVKKSKSVATYTKFLNKAKIVLGFGSEVRRISTNEFRIELQPRPKKYLYFRTDTMCCDCVHGRRGDFCEHLSAIVNTVDCEVMKCPVLTEEDKVSITRVAGGDIEEEVKPEICEDINNFEIYDDKDEEDKQSIISDVIANDDNLESVASSPKSEGQDDFSLHVKTEKPDRFDPLEEESDNVNQMEFVITENLAEPTTSRSDMKRKYETALRAVNDEFRRLNRFFSENPNASNLATMTRLARELGKIRPVERVNLDNLTIQLNANKKRKRNDC